MKFQNFLALARETFQKPLLVAGARKRVDLFNVFTVLQTKCTNMLIYARIFDNAAKCTHISPEKLACPPSPRKFWAASGPVLVIKVLKKSELSLQVPVLKFACPAQYMLNGCDTVASKTTFLCTSSEVLVFLYGKHRWLEPDREIFKKKIILTIM